MTDISDKLKRRAKVFMLKAAITLSASAGMSGMAAAQNVSSGDKNNDVIEQGYNSRRVEMDVPAIFGEKSIELSKENLWKMVQAAELDNQQIDAFIKDMAKLMKSPQGVTDKNLKWMLENGVKSEVYSKRQAEIMTNKAIEFNMPVKMPNETVLEDTIRSGEEGFAVSGTVQNNFSDYSRVGTDGQSFSYSFENGKLNVQHGGLVDLKGIFPPLMQKSDGSYRCGAATGTDRAGVILQEKQSLGRVVVEHMVYQDLAKCQQNGEDLGKDEKGFMTRHVQDLKQHGLSVGKKGLQRIETAQIQQIMQSQNGR